MGGGGGGGRGEFVRFKDSAKMGDTFPLFKKLGFPLGYSFSSSGRMAETPPGKELATCSLASGHEKETDDPSDDVRVTNERFIRKLNEFKMHYMTFHIRKK